MAEYRRSSVDDLLERLPDAFEQPLKHAQALEALAPDTALPGACDFLMAALSGMKIAGKGGATVEQLTSIAGFAIQAMGNRN